MKLVACMVMALVCGCGAEDPITALDVQRVEPVQVEAGSGKDAGTDKETGARAETKLRNVEEDASVEISVSPEASKIDARVEAQDSYVGPVDAVSEVGLDVARDSAQDSKVIDSTAPKPDAARPPLPKCSNGDLHSMSGGFYMCEDCLLAYYREACARCKADDGCWEYVMCLDKCPDVGSYAGAAACPSKCIAADGAGAVRLTMIMNEYETDSEYCKPPWGCVFIQKQLQ